MDGMLLFAISTAFAFACASMQTLWPVMTQRHLPHA